MFHIQPVFLVVYEYLVVLTIHVCIFVMFVCYFVFVQRTKRAVQRPSSALDHTCASLSVGSVTGTRTVLMGLMRASKLAVVRLRLD